MNRKIHMMLLLAASVLLLNACSSKIYGTVQLVDHDLNPIDDEVRGTVVNMINTTATIDQASHSVAADEKGNFMSEKKALSRGTYKVEVSKLGYDTETTTLKIGRATKKKLDIKLKKIQEGKRRSIGSDLSDKDKIINPGEVNIQPPVL